MRYMLFLLLFTGSVLGQYVEGNETTDITGAGLDGAFYKDVKKVVVRR